ncbi:hypothetical protein SAMN02927924_01449 [Sphingobium faniae]|nr:hypothetical protein SAMN02927924_01449 [Sphingobium faniae]
MNVSKEAREAAAAMLDAYRDRLAPDEQRESMILAINVRNGLCDDSPRVQAFAKFEAEITQRVRDEALKEAAVKAISIGEQYGEDETGWLDCSETIATAIRQMIGGKA